MKRYLPFLLLLLASQASAQVFIAQGETTAALKRMPVALVDATDGYTPETAIAIAANNDSDCGDSTDECCVSKDGAAEVYCAGTLTHVGFGVYYYEAAAAEIDTIGYLTLRINDSAARQFVGVAVIGLSDAGFWANMLAATKSELASVPGTGAVSIGDMLRFVYQQFRNKVTDNGTAQKSYKADGTTELCTRTVSDNGTTYTKGACN